MSSMDFGVPDFCFLISEPLTPALIYASPCAAHRSWVHGLINSFLRQLLINLKITVLPQPEQEREPSRRRPWHQGPGDADCRWNLFSMYCQPVGQVIFAN